MASRRGTPALVVDGVLRLPGGFTDEESLRNWLATQPVLEGGQVSWREGGLWIETEGWDVRPLPLLTTSQPESNGNGSGPQGVPIVIDNRLRVPGEVVDLESFREWMHSEDYPEHVRYSWLDGTLWIDRTMEQLYTHNDVKTAIAGILRSLALQQGRGRFFGDGMRLSHPGAGLSTDPDGLFFSYDAVRSGRIHQVAGRTAGVTQLEGSPQMVLEVVSEYSVEKDTVTLPDQYHRAEVQEFWRVDAQTPELVFEILTWQPSGWVAAPLVQSGWLLSQVFGHSFRLVRVDDPLGDPVFRLEHQPAP
jgi:Uma2 family endonuclease